MVRVLGQVLGFAALCLGAFLFLFPFYYMVVGALQERPDPSIAGAFPGPDELSLVNFQQINERVPLLQALLNSLIYTGGVILGTLTIGILAGYALSRLRWRGRELVFNIVLLTLIVPFQLLMIPMYVMVVRTWGLGDTYLGMILPFLVNSTAVFVFRQFFLQIPEEMLDAARIDGAGELRILTQIVLPLSRPAILTAGLITFIGPWNEFLWPFLVTKQQELQPLAVALANYISTVAASTANPFGAILAGAVVLAIPAVALFVIFQRYFVQSETSAGLKE
ncbi:carbohydrate ABC transporter permease [Rubrobacter taiwanensis]|uniref:Carbohydrate ABC transporter permease n=1 Tax=Rubrobacter taiwanensis TaxID=185139 RepID=A0A4V2NX71_9ACTN|nr:carbohydrate ABC transporter permease [Rubrobacter taiwanensis]